jgi:ATP-dependent RNA circularization protein (DNA/RNA ligase family)
LDSNENTRIKELLDLENNISNEDRANELKKALLEKLVSKVSLVNSEADVLEELKKQPHLNNIPLVVKRHFNLQE